MHAGQLHFVPEIKEERYLGLCYGPWWQRARYRAVHIHRHTCARTLLGTNSETDFQILGEDRSKIEVMLQMISYDATTRFKVSDLAGTHEALQIHPQFHTHFSLPRNKSSLEINVIYVCVYASAEDFFSTI